MSRQRRPRVRALALAALLASGGVAATQLHVDLQSRRAGPELTLRLSAPASDPGETARRFLAPVEERLYTLPEVETAIGEVTADGAELRLRLRGDARGDEVVARLQAELAGGDTGPQSAPSRSGGRWVVSAGPGAAAAETAGTVVVWLAGRDPAAARRIAALVRDVPGVADLTLLGAPPPEVALEIAPQAALAEAALGSLDATLAAAARGGAVRPHAQGGLTVVEKRWLPASGDLAELASALGDLPVAFGSSELPLRSLGRVVTRSAPMEGAARHNAVAAAALLVRPDSGAAALVFERALRSRLAAAGEHHVVWREAATLRALLRRLGAALIVTTLAAAALGWRRGGGRGALALAAAPPALVAAAACGWWLTATTAHPATLVAGALAVASLLPIATRRVLQGASVADLGWSAALTATAVAVAAAFAPMPLRAMLAETALAFAVAMAAGVLCLPLLATAPAARTRGGGLLRAALRDAGTTLLFAASAAAVLGLGWGAALLPRPASISTSGADLTAQLVVKPEATVAETLPRAATVEERLRTLPGIEETWVLVMPGSATVEARLAPSLLRGDLLRRQLRIARALLGDTAAVEAPALGAAELAADSLTAAWALGAGPRPQADAEGFYYRVLLRSQDLPVLEAAYSRLRERLAELKVRDSWVAAWEPRSPRLRLEPRPSTPARQLDELERALARRTSPPPAVRAPGGEERLLRLVPPQAPRDATDLPQAGDLLSRPLWVSTGPTIPSTAFSLRRDLVRGRVLRQDGRFVVPVEIRPPYAAEMLRRTMRQRWDAALAALPLPAGSELLRPGLGSFAVRWQPERARLAAFAVCLPLLLYALATVRVGRLGLAAALLLPIVLGAFAAAPLAAASGGLDELGLFALLAAAAGALGAAAAATIARPPASSRRLYAALRRTGGGAVGGGLLAVLAALAPTVGADAARAGWVMPLRLAAVAGGTAQVLALVVVPALLVGTSARRRWRSAAARAARRPPGWLAAAPPRLEARSLVKVYPAPGVARARARAPWSDHRPASDVRALDRVSFTLEPGIVGLLGPNGAGKTTLLRILTGIVAPSRGGVRLADVPVAVHNLAAYRRQIGFLPQGFDAYSWFTAEQFLDHWARERGMRDATARRREIAALLGAVGLAEHGGRRVRDFSGGMRQRVGIARALLGAPPVLVVDEPTTGLDLEGRQRVRDVLLAVAAERIIVFSTHIASDVETIAGRLLLLDAGRLRFDGAPAELVARGRGRVFEALVDDDDLADVGHRYRITSRVREVDRVRIRAVAAAGQPLAGPAVEPNLEEAYLAELSSPPAQLASVDR